MACTKCVSSVRKENGHVRCCEPFSNPKLARSSLTNGVFPVNYSPRKVLHCVHFKQAGTVEERAVVRANMYMREVRHGK